MLYALASLRSTVSRGSQFSWTLNIPRRAAELRPDPARGRVFSTSYGEGTLYGWKLPEPDGDVERAGTVSLGSPLRGLDLLSTSGDILVGSGCGVFRINPEEALGL